MQKITTFLKYNNALPLAVAILLLGMSSAFASSDVREAVVAKTENIVSIDNGLILDIDLDTFDPGLRITQITENDRNYYVTFEMKTLSIVDYVWQEIVEENMLTIEKSALKGGDLGEYLTSELAELVDHKIAYLKRVQENERELGRSKKIASVAYSGIIGKYFDSEEKEFPGYDPVVKQKPPKIALTEVTSQEPSDEPTENVHIDTAMINALIEAKLKVLLGQNTNDNETDDNDDSQENETDETENSDQGGSSGEPAEEVPAEGSEQPVGEEASSETPSAEQPEASPADNGGSEASSEGSDTSSDNSGESSDSSQDSGNSSDAAE